MKTALLVGGTFLIVLVLWIYVGFLPAWNQVPGFDFTDNGKLDPIRPGVFGDSFGWVNSLFSALAFAGVLVTLYLQRTELQLQREEMQLTRQELKTTREEHRRMAQAQEKSENRLFLAAYMNALESLRQLSQWRMSADPARTENATYPVVEGLVVQSRVSHSLQRLVRDLESELIRIHPRITAVVEEGSRVWILEQFLNVYLELRSLIGTHKARSDDRSAFEEAVNITRVNLHRLRELKNYLETGLHEAIEDIAVKAPDPQNLTGSDDDSIRARDARRKHFDELERTNNKLLGFIMRMCYE